MGARPLGYLVSFGKPPCDSEEAQSKGTHGDANKAAGTAHHYTLSMPSSQSVSSRQEMKECQPWRGRWQHFCAGVPRVSECQSLGYELHGPWLTAHAPLPILQGTWRLCAAPGYKAPT